MIKTPLKINIILLESHAIKNLTSYMFDNRLYWLYTVIVAFRLLTSDGVPFGVWPCLWPWSWRIWVRSLSLNFGGVTPLPLKPTDYTPNYFYSYSLDAEDEFWHFVQCKISDWILVLSCYTLLILNFPPKTIYIVTLTDWMPKISSLRLVHYAETG